MLCTVHTQNVSAWLCSRVHTESLVLWFIVRFLWLICSSLSLACSCYGSPPLKIEQRRLSNFLHKLRARMFQKCWVMIVLQMLAVYAWFLTMFICARYRVHT